MSKGAPSSRAGTPVATAAFSSRAPSRCSFSPSSRAVATTACSSSSGHTVPPALLCVFSSATTDVRGVWKLPSSCIVARICSGERRPW